MPPNAEVIANRSAFKLGWWRDPYFSGELRHFWPERLNGLRDSNANPAYKLITREDVFDVVKDGGPHVNVRAAVAACVLGVGKSAYQVGWMVLALPVQADVEDRLDQAAELLHSRGAVAAYQSMMHGGANKVKYMGSAYFTKFLFFIGYRNPATPQPAPLILNKRVATALRRWNVPGGWLNGGWTTSTYSMYLNFSQQTAGRARRGGEDTPRQAIVDRASSRAPQTGI